MSVNITILGAGSWGMAVGYLLNQNGHRVTMWEYDPEACRCLQQNRQLPDKLASFILPESIAVTGDINSAMASAEVLVLAVPSQAMRATLGGVADELGRMELVINVSKGVENKSLMRMSEVIADQTPVDLSRIVTVSGPSHAEEVIRDMPTTVVAGGTNPETSRRVQELFSCRYFRVYNSEDLIGVELGGSLKNIIAIAAGISDGLGLGDNTKGALITRGLAEMSRYGVATGASAETFAGLSGIGDLVTTCFSRHSRNRSVGERIGRGEKLDEILRSMSMVAEGVATTRSGYELALRHEVEMPITTEVYRVLFEGKDPSEAVGDLMGRELKAEIWY